MCAHVRMYIYICICVVVMSEMLLTFNVVHGRCWCPLYHVITLDPHCVYRIASFLTSVQVWTYLL
jgi:hypothetical protein